MDGDGSGITGSFGHGLDGLSAARVSGTAPTPQLVAERAVIA
jgi:hypothetical protein